MWGLCPDVSARLCRSELSAPFLRWGGRRAEQHLFDPDLLAGDLEAPLRILFWSAGCGTAAS